MRCMISFHDTTVFDWSRLVHRRSDRTWTSLTYQLNDSVITLLSKITKNSRKQICQVIFEQNIQSEVLTIVSLMFVIFISSVRNSLFYSGLMDTELNRQIQFDPVPPLQFLYENISVQAEVEEEVPDNNGGYIKVTKQKILLKECSGKFEPSTMTAVLGPSGSGKTTMLNLLSGRLLSKNLKLRGSIKINGKNVTTMADYKSVIGYVMQEDLMLPTFTPRETFRFIVDMRLPLKSEEQKENLVETMIDSLGLKHAAETYIGNSLIRGLSGGEKKRASVGVELLINPSLIFLDEPTTGLDSTTALNLIRLLNRLANAGRTVVTTIHQPSSEIFLEFDMIMLMLDGNIIYHSHARDSMRYFSTLGMPVPPHSNPMDHYMKLMNKEGIMLQFLEEEKEFKSEQIQNLFQQRVGYLVRSFKASEPPVVAKLTQPIEHHESAFAPWMTQFFLIARRSIINQLRNPLGIRMKIFQTIFFSVVTIILYQRQASSLDSYLQNMRGVIFFLVMNMCFSAIFGSINIFSQEKPVFIRERLSNTYQTSSYFFGRSLAYLPLELFLPVLMIVICYFVVHLDNSGDSFMIVIGASWLASWMASAYGLLLSTAFSDPEVALSLVPLLIIPLMLVGGFFAPLTSVPDFYRIFEYISVFKYLYQTIIYSQFYKYPNGFTVTLGSTEHHYRGNILSKGDRLYFEEPFWLSMMLMGLIGLAIRVLSFIALYFISNPPTFNLEPQGSKKSLSKKSKQNEILMIDLEGNNSGLEKQESSMIAIKE